MFEADFSRVFKTVPTEGPLLLGNIKETLGFSNSEHADTFNWFVCKPILIVIVFWLCYHHGCQWCYKLVF